MIAILNKSTLPCKAPTIGALCLAAIVSVGASAYEIETTIGASEDPGDRSPTYRLGVEYFFTPLNHGSGAPRQELPFLERVSTLKVSATEMSESLNESETIEYGGGYTDEYELQSRIKIRGIDAEYVFREAGNPHAITVGGSIIKTKTRIHYLQRQYYQGVLQNEYEDSDAFEVDAQALYLGYDNYIGEKWTVGAEIGHARIEAYGDEDDFTTASLRTERLWQLPKNQWVGLKAEATHLWIGGATGWNFEATGKFYLNERTGIYVSGEANDADDTRTFEGGVSHYFTDAIFARLFGSTTRFDDDYGDDITESGWGIVFGIRL